MVALVATGCGLAGPKTIGTTPMNGGTATYALPPNNTPYYIFPFTSGSYFTAVNSDNLQYLLYRPLYWFGGAGTPFLNENLSLADRPVYKGQVVTIRLKPYKWSNGEPVTARDVIFWMNMMKAVGQSDWGAYVPHEFPDNISSFHAVGSDVVQMTIKGHYSNQWFTDNELSQITPMPATAWDRTGTQKSACADRISDCAAVYHYLDSQGQNPSSWPQSPLWKVVDGPWQLTGYNSQGVFTFTYNKSYSGPKVKNHITTFQEVPFTSEEAEFNVLQAGGSNGVDVGYMPTVDAPVPPPYRSVGQNPVPGYQLHALYSWGVSYFPYNFTSTDPQLPIIRQTYFRQALQLLENQAAIIQGPLHGYGRVTTGPVGVYPPTTYLSPTAKRGDPYPYNPAQARTLLSDHGWTVNPGGVSTCTQPTECGPGIKAGAPLSFTIYYATGTAWIDSAMLALKSNASQLGIKLNVVGMTFQDVITKLSPHGCDGKPCPWSILDWGQGWSYVPDYLPTGDVLFMTDAAGNYGGYSNQTNDELVTRTLHTSDLHAMWKWQNYLTKQLPVVFQPDAPYELIENIDSLHIGPQSPTLAITPEDWYFLR